MNVKQPMLSVDAALERILSAAAPIPESEIVSTLDADGRILAEALVSQLNVPPEDNAAMDGYAVRAADCAQGDVQHRISQRIPAGSSPLPLEAGTAARIFTGASIPPGADAVVMQELCEPHGADGVIIHRAPKAGESIRRIGEDIKAGSVLLPSGTRMRAQETGLAASVGLNTVSVRRRVRVAVLFTGSELVMPGQPLKPGMIYNSNYFTLQNLLKRLGCRVTDCGTVADSLDATIESLRLASSEHDLIVTSGGVSVGEEDHVKPAVQAQGHLDVWQIAIKPGKPLAFGQIKRADSPNPVSSFITFLLFVRPFILRLQGVEDVAPRFLLARADFAWPKAEERNHFLRARINSSGGLDLFPNQGSGVLTSTVWGDGLVDKPPGHTIKEGDMVRFVPFSSVMD